MADVANLGNIAAEHFTDEPQFPVDVEQLVLNLHQLASRRAGHLAHEQIILGEHLPVAKKDIPLLARQTEQVFPRKGEEFANLLEIVGDDFRHVFGAEGKPAGLERHHGNGDGVIHTLGDLDAEFSPGDSSANEQHECE